MTVGWRWSTLAAVLLTATFVAIVALWWFTAPRHHAITEANYDRVRVGMSLAELESVFEAPPGNYRTCNGIAPVATMGRMDPTIWWASDELTVNIWFGPDGTVAEKSFDCLIPVNFTVWDKVGIWMRRNHLARW